MWLFTCPVLSTIGGDLMASECWVRGFDCDGRPILHWENDGPAFLREVEKSDGHVDWSELTRYIRL